MAWTIDDPSEHFQVAKWTGNSQGDAVASRTITNDGNSDLQPDMLWTIPTDIDSYNWIYDTTRGLASNKGGNPATSDAMTSGNGGVGGYPSAVTSDGFTVVKGSSGTVATEYVNQAAHEDGTTAGHATSYVAYQWKANGGTTTSFSAESAASGSLLAGSYQANTTSGFSIVTYTGDGGTPRTALHGLGVAPEVIITKRIPSAGSWIVLGDYMHQGGSPWHSNAMELDTTDNSGGSKNTVGGNNPATTTRYYIGDHDDVNASSSTYISYCFAPKKGFSKFGWYEGIANANGPFIYTGFKPAWVLVKNLDNDGWNWALIDHKRTPFNGEGVAKWFWPDLAQKEFTDTQSGIDMDMDLLSNGFKITTARSELNLASTFFYMAFAEQPFVTSDGVPVTGR